MQLRFLWARALFIALFMVVTFLTLTPQPETTEQGFFLARWLASAVFGDPALTDKVGHFIAYGALGASAAWAQVTFFNRKWSIPVTLAIYGAALEGLQGLGGVRTPELADAVANSLGAVAGFVGAVILSTVLRMRAA